MIKKINTFVILLFTITLFAIENPKTNIKLDKHYKIENTFSGDLSNENSFHLIFTKNKKSKKFDVFTYIFDGTSVTELKPIESKKKLSVVSFHKKNNTLSLLLSYKNKGKKFLKEYTVDTTNNEIIASEAMNHEDFVASFREKNRSVLIYKTDETLVFKNFTSLQTVKTATYTFSKKDDYIKEYFEDESVEAVKTDEFVANGAIGTLRSYLKGDDIFFTKENQKKNTTALLKLSLNSERIEGNNIKIFTNKNNKKRFKKHTSYYNNDHLFLLGLNKKTGTIRIFDTNTSKELSSITIDSSIKEYIKADSKFSGIEKFLKKAGKNRFNPTITVNKTTTENLKVRIDYVDKDYNYHYNWWWHHHQFMMWQNHMQMQQINFSRPGGFGPSQPSELPFYLAKEQKQKRFFEIIIDSNGLLNNEANFETTFKDIDKKKHIDNLENKKKIKHKSSCFLDNSFRYIGYNKRQKIFFFKTETLK